MGEMHGKMNGKGLLAKANAPIDKCGCDWRGMLDGVSSCVHCQPARDDKRLDAPKPN